MMDASESRTPQSPTPATEPASPPGLRETLSRVGRFLLADHFEGVFVLVTLAVLGVILYVIDQKLSLLDLYFVPVLAAGVFLDARRAVLGALLAVAWVTFFAVIDPDGFSQEMGPMGLYLHLLSWGSLLILTGAITGRMAEKLQERYRRAAEALAETTRLREELSRANERLEEKNLTLEVTKAKVEAVLYASMDPHVAKLIIERRLRNERRELTVLFSDLVDFSRAVGDRPPEAVVEELNRTFAELEPVVTRFRGHVDKFLGAGLMVEFGVPFVAEHHALMGVLAAAVMHKRIAERHLSWKMRVGVATGPALVGLIGSEHRKNYTAVGDTANLAAQLQASCPEGSTCVDEATHEAVKHFFRTRRIREGLRSDEVSQLEARLELVSEALSGAPTGQLALEAADLASRLGDMGAALRWHRRALELDPSLRQPVERAISAALLSGQERDAAPSDRRGHYAAYEVLGLRDFVEDARRVPPAAAEVYRRLSKELWLAEEYVLSVEAATGTLGHAPVSAALCAALGSAAGLDDRQCKEAFVAGYLHDIGKRAVPDFLLAREDRLEQLPPVDQDVLRSHVKEAERTINEWGLPRSPEALEAILQHHERLDGSGYPAALKGSQIGVLGRVLAVADTYDDLTAWHPRQESLAPAAALAQLRAEARAGRLDAPLVERFAQILAPIV